MPDQEDDSLGGHEVKFYTSDEFQKAAPKLYQYFIDMGYINEDGTLN